MRTDPAELEAFVRRCSDCRQPIMWAKTVASKLVEWMPLDAAPVSTGNVAVYRDPARTRHLVCDVVGNPRKRAGMAADGWSFWQHHRLSCPHADRWARQPKSMRPQPPATRATPIVDTVQPQGLFS